MNKTALIKQLREAAEILEPLTRSPHPAARVWNGATWAKPDANAKSADPYALAWWMALRTIASLLEAQDSPISSQQISYLHKELFGGMGSFNDLSFPTADSINIQLRAKRQELYSSFKS
jgi:hypothetical protein